MALAQRELLNASTEPEVALFEVRRIRPRATDPASADLGQCDSTADPAVIRLTA